MDNNEQQDTIILFHTAESWTRDKDKVEEATRWLHTQRPEIQVQNVIIGSENYKWN